MRFSSRALLLLLLLATTASAEQLPSRSRGVSADSLYQVGDVDNINLFNGNLSIAIPLGQSFTVSPQLSYRLTLVYNSSVWDYEDELHCLQDNVLQYYNFPFLVPTNNAGMGWSLHFGRLAPPNDPQLNKNNPSWLFVAPDGSQHNFYPNLHPTEPAVANTFYSLDGAYLRLKILPNAAATVESPDGLIRTFTPSAGIYRLTEIKDRFANWVRAAYSLTTWTITDSQGRSHALTLDSKGNVTKAEIEAFGKSTATYNLSYTVTEVERHRFNRLPCDTDANHTEYETEARLLNKLEEPDGSAYHFTYDTTDATSTSFSGAIRSMILPTGGRVEWDYATYSFQSQAMTLRESTITQQRGIGARRTYLDPVTTTVNGSWTYDYTPGYEGPPGPFHIACFHRMRVSDNISQQLTDSYFATAGGRDMWWYGLPYAPCDPGNTGSSPVPWSPGNTTPYLSTRVYRKQANGPPLPVRSTYVIYDSDGHQAGNLQDRNSRLRYQKIVYHDDEASPGQPHTQEAIYSDFDGLGHFRSVLRRSSFGPDRTSTTSYLPAGSYQLNPDTAAVITDTFTLPSTSSPWVLGLASGATTSENGSVSQRETCFDAATGFLLRQRLRAGSAQQNNDVVAAFEEGDDVNGHGGFVVAERFYGGDDSNNVPSGALCGINLDSPAFVKRSSYESGSLTRSAWVEPCSESEEILVTDEVAEIDPGTGLPVTAIAQNGLAMYLDYDTLGRLLSEVPEEGASRVHKYITFPPTYEVRDCPQGETQFCATAQRLSDHFWSYDGLGRVATKALAYPGESGDAEPSVTFTLDGLGRKTAESTWGGAHQTVFTDFDVFGRPRNIAPQGTYSTQLTFRGDRLKSRKVQVATSSGGSESVFATESYDHLGRLEAVCDGATAEWDGASACTGQLTLYSYNPEDRLIHVCQNAQQSSCGQQRSFSWDGRGFLVAETHPEIGASGNGTITYQRDARGNTTYRDIQNDSGDRPLAFSYDRAGRPILIEEQVSTGWRPLKEFFYARDNRPGSSEKRRGQLVMAKRTNWLKVLDPLPPLIEGTIPVVVTDHYEYFGLGGRASKKTTSISLPSGNQSWTTEFAYDELGNIAGIQYPRGDWPYQTAPARQVSFSHRLGFLTGIPGYADALNYQLGGMLREIDYANGVSWRQTAEAATGWERTAKIETLNTADQVLWSTGTYNYDGAGNISRVGNRGYVYDKFSRLKSALIDFQGIPEQAATFDAYGNLIALANNGTTRPLTASPATNRLTTPGSAYTSNGELAIATIDGVRFEYAYDGLGQQLFEQTTSKTWVYAYDASDDRVLSWECALDRCGTGTNYERYTLRGLGGEVLRVFEGPKRALLAWKEDFVYRDGKPLAWVKPDPAGEKTFFLHADHLGSTRQVTNSAGSQAERHDYLPFGEESTATATGDVKLKFTGHERDQHGKPMDYMKARMCSPVLARFLAPDPVMQAKRAVQIPQQWNRYTYVMNNPLKYTDPTGKDVSIRLDFTGEGWTAEDKDKIITEVKAWYESKNVGKVYVFDGAKARHGGNFLSRFGKSYTSIEVSTATSSMHTPETVFAGVFAALSPGQRITAISNSIAHETVVHHFNGTLINMGDIAIFSRDGGYILTEDVSERKGTVADSQAFKDLDTMSKVTDGPIPIHPGDLIKLQQKLNGKVEPPEYDN